MNILTLLQETGTETCKASGTKGGEYHGPCPGCGGRDRFHVWPEQNSGAGSWWCRGCEKGGDCIQFMRDYMNMNFREAAERMGKKLDNYERPNRYAGIKPLAAAARKNNLNHDDVASAPELWAQKASNFVKYCCDELHKNESALSMLKNRGIRPDTASRFHLGYNPKDLFRAREAWGLPQALKDNGQPKKLWVPSGLVIPYFRNDHLVRVRIRRPEGEPRYYMVPGSVTGPIPAMICRSTWTGAAKAVLVVEAELDAILLAQFLGDVADIVSLGNASTRPKDSAAAKLLSEADWIGLLMDNDDAGTKGVEIWRQMFSTAVDIRACLGSAKDPGDVQDHEALRGEILKLMPPPMCWRDSQPAALQQSRGGAEKSTKEQAAPEVQPVIADSVRRLGLLLRHAGFVRLIWAESGRMGIEVPNDKLGWHHSEPGKEINSLFWHDPDVEAWLDAHPQEVITSANFWEPLNG